MFLFVVKFCVLIEQLPDFRTLLAFNMFFIVDRFFYTIMAFSSVCFVITMARLLSDALSGITDLHATRVMPVTALVLNSVIKPQSRARGCTMCSSRIQMAPIPSSLRARRCRKSRSIGPIRGQCMVTACAQIAPAFNLTLNVY